MGKYALVVQTLKNDGIEKFFDWEEWPVSGSFESDILETRQIRDNITSFFRKNIFIGG
jgi:hypothetical protein